MKKPFRWSLFIVLAVLVVAALVPAFSLLHSGRTVARAAGPQSAGPTLSTSVGSVPVWHTFTVTGQGFAPDETVNMSLETPTSTNNFLGTLACDSTGLCTGTMTAAPATPVPQGVYTLVGVGETSGLTAQTSIEIGPNITLDYPLSGASHYGEANTRSHLIGVGPGTEVEAKGYSFGSAETVQVYLGTASGMLEGTPRADALGTLLFSFTTPGTLTPGWYFVTVVRSGQKPATLASQFHIIPSQMTASAGIHGSQPIWAILKGFQAGEQVTLSWNANGGQVLGTLSMDPLGSVRSCTPESMFNCIVPPAAPPGSYTLTATGDSSGLKATSGLNVGPGIALSPDEVGPGNTITVNGGGFTPDEKVKVYFQTTANGLISTTTDASGAFSVSLTVPRTYQQNTTYYVHAVNVAGTESVRTQFTFLPPYLNFQDDTLYWGTFSAFFGAGFWPNETVNLYWNYQKKGQKKVATLTADQNGGLSGTLKIPSDPDLPVEFYAAIGVSSGLKAIEYTDERPGLATNPGQGAVGTSVHITGGGFASQETVTITLNSNSTASTIATVTSDYSGGISTTVVIPNLPTGFYSFEGVGASSSVDVTVGFTITG